jgi:hypothetical protein
MPTRQPANGERAACAIGVTSPGPVRAFCRTGLPGTYPLLLAQPTGPALAPGKLQTLGGPDDVAYVAEQVPCDAYWGSFAPSLDTGSELQTLG